MARDLHEWGKTRGVDFLFPQHEASVLLLEGKDKDAWLAKVDVALVIGGDGTFLRAARFVLGHDVSLYGINRGRLGFLAFGKPETAIHDIEQILAGRYSVLNRATLEARIVRNGEVINRLYALNDVVLNKSAAARLLHIEVLLNHKSFGILPADGVIVATPTGSTAYSLSAGGPVVPAYIPCMIMSPICAHTLYSRSVIAGRDDVVTLIPGGESRDMLLTQDGQLTYEILPDDQIIISLSSDRFVRSVQLHERSFMELLQEKLGWGQISLLESKE
jgi:NAD+ kinase